VKRAFAAERGAGEAPLMGFAAQRIISQIYFAKRLADRRE